LTIEEIKKCLKQEDKSNRQYSTENKNQTTNNFTKI